MSEPAQTDQDHFAIVALKRQFEPRHLIAISDMNMRGQAKASWRYDDGYEEDETVWGERLAALHDRVRRNDLCELVRP